MNPYSQKRGNCPDGVGPDHFRHEETAQMGCSDHVNHHRLWVRLKHRRPIHQALSPSWGPVSATRNHLQGQRSLSARPRMLPSCNPLALGSPLAPASFLPFPAQRGRAQRGKDPAIHLLCISCSSCFVTGRETKGLPGLTCLHV